MTTQSYPYPDHVWDNAEAYHNVINAQTDPQRKIVWTALFDLPDTYVLGKVYTANGECTLPLMVGYLIKGLVENNIDVDMVFDLLREQGAIRPRGESA